MRVERERLEREMRNSVAATIRAGGTITHATHLF
jgi:hypothetical protein